MSIGQENLPKSILNSKILDENDLKTLSTFSAFPADRDVQQFAREPEVSAILDYFLEDPDGLQMELHKLAKTYLQDGDPEKAWKTLMQS